MSRTHEYFENIIVPFLRKKKRYKTIQKYRRLRLHIQYRGNRVCLKKVHSESVREAFLYMKKV